jgi:predicted metal-dependent hydrolase
MQPGRTARRLLPPADEDEVGKLQPSRRQHRLNTELVKKPKDLLEYVVVHEMAHLLEPTHSERFVSILDQNFPRWREARAELNELPLGAEKWGE